MLDVLAESRWGEEIKKRSGLLRGEIRERMSNASLGEDERI